MKQANHTHPKEILAQLEQKWQSAHAMREKIHTFLRKSEKDNSLLKKRQSAQQKLVQIEAELKTVRHEHAQFKHKMETQFAESLMYQQVQKAKITAFLQQNLPKLQQSPTEQRNILLQKCQLAKQKLTEIDTEIAKISHKQTAFQARIGRVIIAPLNPTKQQPSPINTQSKENQDIDIAKKNIASKNQLSRSKHRKAIKNKSKFIIHLPIIRFPKISISMLISNTSWRKNISIIAGMTFLGLTILTIFLMNIDSEIKDDSLLGILSYTIYFIFIVGLSMIRFFIFF